MDTRKIQTVGGGTYTVSLPKEWAEAQNIDTGDVVDLHTHIDGVLVLQPQERDDDAPGRVAVRVDDDDPAPLERTLRAAYSVGAREVRFEAADGFTAAQRRVVDRVARTLTGVSVTGETDSALTVRTLLDTGEVSVRQSVRELKFVALSMHREATAAATDDANPGALADRDEQADRIYAMIDRAFARGLDRLDEVDALGLTRPELFELWGTTRELERVADHAEGIAALASDLEEAPDEATRAEVRDVAQAARDVVADAVGVVVGDAEVETAQEALAARERVLAEISTCRRRLSASDGGSQFGPVLDRIRRTAEHGGNVAEFGLRRAIRRGDLAASGAGDESGDADPQSHTAPESD